MLQYTTMEFFRKNARIIVLIMLISFILVSLGPIVSIFFQGSQ